MVRTIACVAVLLAALSTLNGSTSQSADDTLSQLHEQRCALLRDNLAAVETLYQSGGITAN